MTDKITPPAGTQDEREQALEDAINDIVDCYPQLDSNSIVDSQDDAARQVLLALYNKADAAVRAECEATWKRELEITRHNLQREIESLKAKLQSSNYYIRQRDEWLQKEAAEHDRSEQNWQSLLADCSEELADAEHGYATIKRELELLQSKHDADVDAAFRAGEAKGLNQLHELKRQFDNQCLYSAQLQSKHERVLAWAIARGYDNG